MEPTPGGGATCSCTWLAGWDLLFHSHCPLQKVELPSFVASKSVTPRL